MKYWLFKSEPSCFSIDNLSTCLKKTTYWDGVRNYQARNMLRDEVKIRDKGFFYHSNCTQPAIVGTFEIVKAGYPDFTAWDIHSDHFDPKSTLERPLWYMVDIQFLEKFQHPIPLETLKKHPLLKNMVVARKGNRLSIVPVTQQEWECILALAH